MLITILIFMANTDKVLVLKRKETSGRKFECGFHSTHWAIWKPRRRNRKVIEEDDSTDLFITHILSCTLTVYSALPRYSPPSSGHNALQLAHCLDFFPNG